MYIRWLLKKFDYAESSVIHTTRDELLINVVNMQSKTNVILILWYLWYDGKKISEQIAMFSFDNIDTTLQYIKIFRQQNHRRCIVEI